MVGREAAPFALLLQRYRVIAGLTQEELAERAGMSARGISDLERAERTRPRTYTVRRLADALGLSPHDRSIFDEAARAGWGVAPAAADAPVASFLGARPSGSLVGRRTEVDAILAAGRAVSAGTSRVVLLEGEPGVGKTRLAQEVSLRLEEAGFALATGRCFESTREVPFAPFLDVLAQLYARSPLWLRAEVPQRWPYLERLLPDEALPPSPASTQTHEGQERLLRAVTGFVQALAESQPVGILLDDLHWADSASLILLLHLARRLAGSAVLVLGTYRAVDVAKHDPLAGVLAHLAQERLAERVQLQGLSLEETGALIRATVGAHDIPEGLTDLVYARTDGNPLFVQEVVAALLERGYLARQERGWTFRNEATQVPESVRLIIGERLARLSEQTQQLLSRASVLGQSFDLRALCSMSEQTEEMVEEALAEAARSGLVRAATNDEYVFHHALVQQAVYLDLPSQRRKRLHRTAGESLERLGIGVAAELARHFAEGEDHERTLTYSLLAGDQAEEVYAHGEAERHYRAALALLDSEPARDSGVRAVRLEATEKLGRVLALTGRYGEAMRLLECAATAYEGARDLEGAARVTATIGLVHARMGSPLEGVSRIDSLLERWEETMAPRDRAPLLCELARVYMFSGRYAEQLDATERAIDLARVAGDDYTLVEAQVRRGAALYFAGRIQEGIQAGEEGIPLAEAVGHLEALFHALGNVGEDYIETGDLTRGQERLERAVALMERLGDPGELSHSLCQLSRVHFLRGAWDQARVLVERAALLAPAEQSTWYAAYPLLARGELHAARGDVEAATRCLEDSAAIARQSDDLQALSRVQATLAELDLIGGHAEEAVSRLEPLLDLPACAGPLRLPLLPVLARARADLGDLERASQFAEVAVRLARWHGLRLGLLDALRVRGAVAAREGRTEEVDSTFTEASVLAADIGCPYQEARVLYDWAVAHSRSGLSEVAESRLGQALAIFRRLGAHLDAERTEQILASL